MSDVKIIKQILENKSKQKLRQSINESSKFIVENESDKKALDEYNTMNEEDKSKFVNKKWINN